MYYDQHGHWVQRLRFALEAAAYPVQVAVSSPRAAWRWLTQSFRGARRAAGRKPAPARPGDWARNERRARRTRWSRRMPSCAALRAALPPLIKKWQLAEIISVETNPAAPARRDQQRRRATACMVNQAVVDGNGVLGQVARVGPWSAEVILVTDPEHAIPVEVTRNSLRSIAVGSGNTGELLLPYLAVNSDVKSGDLLVSSGLGGVFPAGLPVARISGVRRENNQLLAQVRAQPLAHVEQDREVMLLQFEPSHPAAPAPNPPIAPEAPPAAQAGAENRGSERMSTAAQRCEP